MIFDSLDYIGQADQRFGYMRPFNVLIGEQGALTCIHGFDKYVCTYGFEKYVCTYGFEKYVCTDVRMYVCMRLRPFKVYMLIEE
jgi:hypothetical protein